MVKVNIDVEIYNMKDGKLVDFFFDGKLYKEEIVYKNKPLKEVMVNDFTDKIIPSENPLINEIKQKFSKKGPKRYPNMIDKWIRAKGVSSFTEDDFFKDHSNLKAMFHRGRFRKYIQGMVGDNTILQWHDNSFKVVNNKNAKM